MESRHSQTTILLMKFELYPILCVLISFSLQRLHLLLIITFKAKRLKRKIDFSKKEIFTIQFTLGFVMKQWQQRWWSQEWTNSVCFKRIYFFHEGFLRSFCWCAQSLCVSLIVKDDISGYKVQYWVCDTAIPSQVLVRFTGFHD